MNTVRPMRLISDALRQMLLIAELKSRVGCHHHPRKRTTLNTGSETGQVNAAFKGRTGGLGLQGRGVAGRAD